MSTGNDPSKFFRDEIDKKSTELKAIKSRIAWVGVARLVSFSGAIIPYFIFPWPLFVTLLFSLVLLGVFLKLVAVHADLSVLKKKLEFSLKFCQNELEALSGKFTAFSDGEIYADPGHAFSFDLDIFGNHSFFQTLNRTSYPESEKLLADLIGENDIANITQRQQVIRELVKKMNWCLEFRSSAALENQLEQDRIARGLNKHESSLPTWIPTFSYVFSSISVLTVLAIAYFDLSWNFLMIPYFLGLFITMPYLKKIQFIHAKTSGLSVALTQIAGLNALLESQEWESLLIREKLVTGEKNKEPYSRLFSKFSKLAAALDQRGNFLFAIFSNGFLLWDLRYAALLDQWIHQHGKAGSAIYHTINWFDAQVSLANYAFTHPEFTYPVLTDMESELVIATGLSHPLIPRERRISNDWTIGQSGFQVITGANMAGKSTFLRTVGLSLVMANSGLPVCAGEFKYHPVKLVTSMRSSDSLGNDASYFFAELSRLRHIVDILENEPRFIILDEILKGTNSKDKEEGSRKFLMRLAETNSSGLIATHDLSLCALADTHPNIHNYYFEAEIHGDELTFDYRLKQGICQNMNASFLLRKMGITR